MKLEALLFILALYKKNKSLVELILPIQTDNIHVIYKTRHEIVIINDLTLKSLERIHNNAALIYNEETKGWYEHGNWK